MTWHLAIAHLNDRNRFDNVSGGKVYDHRLMGFNNDSATSSGDIGHVFEVTRKAIKGRLDLQAMRAVT